MESSRSPSARRDDATASPTDKNTEEKDAGKTQKNETNEEAIKATLFSHTHDIRNAVYNEDGTVTVELGPNGINVTFPSG